MKYIVLTHLQLIVLAILISIITTAGVGSMYLYMFYTQLPVVHIDKSNACVKVDNFENGHAFNCNDVDVLLRRYRKSAE
jgi:hypothetical protein